MTSHARFLLYLHLHLSEELHLSQEIYFGFIPLEIKKMFTNRLDESHVFPVSGYNLIHSAVNF